MQVSASPRLNEQMTPRALFEMVKDDQTWAAQMHCKFAKFCLNHFERNEKSPDSVRFVSFRLYYWTIHQGNLAKAHWATFPLPWHSGMIGVRKRRSKQWLSTVPLKQVISSTFATRSIWPRHPTSMFRIKDQNGSKKGKQIVLVIDS